MKKLLLVAALVLALAVPAIAAPPSQMNYGCGLGAVVFKDGRPTTACCCRWSPPS